MHIRFLAPLVFLFFKLFPILPPCCSFKLRSSSSMSAPFSYASFFPITPFFHHFRYWAILFSRTCSSQVLELTFHFTFVFSSSFLFSFKLGHCFATTSRFWLHTWLVLYDSVLWNVSVLKKGHQTGSLKPYLFLGSLVNFLSDALLPFVASIFVVNAWSSSGIAAYLARVTLSFSLPLPL